MSICEGIVKRWNVHHVISLIGKQVFEWTFKNTINCGIILFVFPSNFWISIDCSLSWPGTIVSPKRNWKHSLMQNHSTLWLLNLNNLSSSSWKVDGQKNSNWRLYFPSERDPTLLKLVRDFRRYVYIFIFVKVCFETRTIKLLTPPNDLDRKCILSNGSWRYLNYIV